MTKMKKKELIDTVKTLVDDITKADIERVLSAYYKVLEEALKQGVSVVVGDVGIFKFSVVKGKPEREGIVNPKTQERGMLPATKAYNKVVFKTSIPLRNDIKEITEDNLF